MEERQNDRRHRFSGKAGSGCHVPLQSALDGVGLSAEVRAALAKRDQRALEELLGSRNVCCLVNAPIEEEDPKDVPVRKDARAA